MKMTWMLKVKEKTESKNIKKVFFKNIRKSEKHHIKKFMYKEEVSTLKLLNYFFKTYNGKANILERFLDFLKCKLRKLAP